MLDEVQIIQAAAEAVAFERGWYQVVSRSKPQPIARRLNNPGAVAFYRDGSGRPHPTAYGFVEFTTEEEGWDALREILRVNLVDRRLSLREFFRGKRGFISRGPEDSDGLAMRVADRMRRVTGVAFSADARLFA